MTSISERARAKGPVGEMPAHERPISEEFRIAAKDWVEKDKAASLLEETKTAVLSQMMLKQGDVPVSRAEMHVKASSQWTEFISSMVEARSAANLARVRMKYIEMRFAEWTSKDANARRERQMGRQAT